MGWARFTYFLSFAEGVEDGGGADGEADYGA